MRSLSSDRLTWSDGSDTSPLRVSSRQHFSLPGQGAFEPLPKYVATRGRSASASGTGLGDGDRSSPRAHTRPSDSLTNGVRSEIASDRSCSASAGAKPKVNEPQVSPGSFLQPQKLQAASLRLQQQNRSRPKDVIATLKGHAGAESSVALPQPEATMERAMPTLQSVRSAVRKAQYNAQELRHKESKLEEQLAEIRLRSKAAAVEVAKIEDIEKKLLKRSPEVTHSGSDEDSNEETARDAPTSGSGSDSAHTQHGPSAESWSDGTLRSGLEVLSAATDTESTESDRVDSDNGARDVPTSDTNSDNADNVAQKNCTKGVSNKLPLCGEPPFLGANSSPGCKTNRPHGPMQKVVDLIAQICASFQVHCVTGGR